ncbi:hypothetical protein MBLNU230_g3458t1 [Neophaeotheca triangularis]
MAYTFAQRILIAIFKVINLIIPWHKLPRYLGALNLLAMRDELREENLFDTYPAPDFQGSNKTDPMPETTYLAARHSSGLHNSLEQPRMGCAGMRFGRNVPRHLTAPPNHQDLMTPNPRTISEKLLARTEFKPATIVNLLAAAWIQFQVHDWAQHFNSADEKWEVKLDKDDSWSERPMRIAKTQVDEPLDETDRKYPAYRNEETHWWDGSQIYGSSEEATAALRSQTDDGTLKVDAINGEHFLPRGADGIPKTGFNNNWWLGLELLHTLFALEHNAICAQLKLSNPAWSGDQIFNVARLINCALMAKIHTVEWTPAILAHPTLDVSMNANWSGLVGAQLTQILGRISPSEAISGIPGSGADSGVAPYSLTEEFVSVYRMHPLIPDNIALFSVETGEHRTTLPISDVAFSKARDPLLPTKGHAGLRFADAFYSFGINHPGAITIHNTPAFLRDLRLPSGERLDLGTLDILRDRERGVPRYCAFRRAMHMAAPTSFLALTGNNASLARELAELYGHDLEAVDLLIGCLCEPLPAGFGFSDTAFRVFILMASRRLKSDRFIAGDFNDEVYTREGIEWVQRETMRGVLVRHFPELRGSLRGSGNAFRPWAWVGRTGEFDGVEIGNAEVEA